MIPQGVVNSFLKRSLEDHLWVKGLTHKQLDAALAQLSPKPQLNPGLRVHQKACFLLGVTFPQFCFWLDMGTGKSLLSLELLKYWFQCGLIKRALIFVTSDKAFDTWEKQLKRFGIDLPITALAGSSEQKRQQLEEFGDGLVLLPYPGALAMVCDRVAAKGKKHKFKLNKKKVECLAAWAQAIIADESTKLGNTQSGTFQMAVRLRKQAKVCYALAGRPFGRDPTMLWAQHYFVDGGATLGETLGLFRAAFFTEKQSYWGGPNTKEYTFKEKLKPVLAKMIRHRSITYAASECIDLPKVVSIREEVSFSGEAQAYYDRVVKQVMGARGNLREMKNGFLRMRQISSGFVGFKDDESGEKVEIEFQENPKLERLLELVEEVPEDCGQLIWYAYTYSGRRIVKELTKLGYEPIWLWSGTKDARAELDRFAKAKRPIAVLQNAVGSMSLDGLQKTASYSMIYESPVGVIEREQSERRLIRDGQEKTVFQYDLLTKGTVDEAVLNFHASGEDLFQALLRNPEKILS